MARLRLAPLPGHGPSELDSLSRQRANGELSCTRTEHIGTHFTDSVCCNHLPACLGLYRFQHVFTAGKLIQFICQSVSLRTFLQNSHPIYGFIACETALQRQLQKVSAPMANSGLTSTQTLLPMPITLDRDMPTMFATGAQASHIVPLIGSLASTLLSVPIKLEPPPR